MADCDCQLTYNVVEVHFKPLLATGAPNPAAVWYESDNIIDWDFSPEVEAGKKSVLRCGGRVKNTMQEADELTGATLKISMCCEDAEVQHVVAGSVGVILYDSSSPPCAIGYNFPTPAEQVNAFAFELRLYLEEISGSNVTGYKELHFYQCLPSFVSEKGGQQEYTSLDYTIKCTDNPNYTVASPVMTWKMLAAIP